MATSKPSLFGPAWKQAIKASADLDRVRRYWDQLSATQSAPALAEATPEQARILASLFSGSIAMSDLLVKHPDWLLTTLTPDRLAHPRQFQGLRRELSDLLAPAHAIRDTSAAFSRLRQFKQREMLRIAARDLARLSDAVQTTAEISNVADVCLSATLQLCWERLKEHSGRPFHQDADERWQPTPFCVLGLGKLGGRELNYSSDVDVIFIYSEEGHVFKEAPRKNTPAPDHGLSNHQFFKRLAEAFIAELTRATSEGALYRIDLRLRPEGDAGPLVRSLSSFENYYSQWGQTWERMMLIKARCVAGDEELAAEFIEMINSFRYPRSVNENVLREVAGMKERIEQEVVKAGELDRNVKLGRGGIREIEFVAQTSQLLHAGHIPFLQGAQTLPTLRKLVDYSLLPAADAESLTEAYCFLRDVEHRLQMDQNLQTHTIPTDPEARKRLARLMGFRSLAEFEAAREKHTGNVRRAYDQLLKSEAPPPSPEHPEDFSAETEWKRFLTDRAFKQVDQSFKVLKQFVHGPGYVHISPRTTDLAWQLLARLLALCPKIEADGSVVPRSPEKPQILSDPDRVLARLDSFIAAYGSRAMLFETWASNPLLFELLVLLFDRSEFLAETAIRTPDLVDDLVLSGRLSRRKTAEETLEDLRHGHDDDDQLLWLRRYHETEFMRLGLRDILGLVDFEQNLLELSNLADACLQYALEVVQRKHKLKAAPFAVIGLGKLGGQEVTYGSDLDIIFVTDSRAKNLSKLARLATEVMDLLSQRTDQGIVFNTDARLRPDGEKGLLVNSLEAFEDYYRHRAQLWEIQSLSRARAVAGNAELGERFLQLGAMLADFRPESVASGFTLPGPHPLTPSLSPTGGGGVRRTGEGEVQRIKAQNFVLAQSLSEATSAAQSTSPALRRAGKGPMPKKKAGLASYTPDWKPKIAQMRLRIEKERTPAGQDALAIKTGSGGLMDAEFIAQALCLAHGWQEPNTQRALERARDAGALPKPDAEALIENYRHLRRIEGILRRWSFAGETELPVDAAPYYRVSVRCGFPTPQAFREALAGCRKVIRSVYTKVFAA